MRIKNKMLRARFLLHIMLSGLMTLTSFVTIINFLTESEEEGVSIRSYTPREGANGVGNYNAPPNAEGRGA